jgi:hypothetical protein
VKRKFDDFGYKFNKKHNKDLRNAHFSLGPFNTNYKSLGADSWKNPTEDFLTNPALMYL